MSSLPEVNRLLALNVSRQQRSERALGDEGRALLALDNDLLALVAQVEGLAQVLQNSRLQGAQHSHASLMSVLRQQAVLRRKLAELAVQTAHLEQARQQQRQALAERENTHAALQRKHHKLRVLHSRLARDQRLQHLRREELDLEDLLTSTP